jgi:hypothetical protein
MVNQDDTPGARFARAYETMQDRLTPWWKRRVVGVQLWLLAVTIITVSLVLWRFPPNLM